MNMRMTCLQATPLLISFLFAGCMSPGRDMLPKGGDMTMPEIYRQEGGIINKKGIMKINVHPASILEENAHQVKSREVNYRSYTREAKNELQSLFKRAKNPAIPFYIYPHLVRANGEAYPKPGISSSFFLYRTNHFVMPNERY